MTALSRARNNSTRRRSFGGCGTCRSRYVKCDERRPTCAMCQYFGLICEGYETGLFFEFENRPSTERGRGGRFRRPLLTEQERESMSQWLVSSVPADSTMRLLEQIDDVCHNTPASRDVQLSCGPFGVFAAGRTSQSIHPDSLHTEVHDPLLQGLGGPGEEPPNSSPIQQATDFRGDFTNPSDTLPAPNTQELLESTEYVSNLAFAPSDVWDNMSPDLGRTDHVLDITCVQDIRDELAITQFAAQDYQIPQPLHSPSDFNHFLQSPTPLSPITDNTNTLPHDAIALLKHYRTTVVGLMTPLQHTKTPWHVLFIPLAKNCIAALALGEELDHASLAAFYRTLAISAFSLAGLFHAEKWLRQAREHKRRAVQHAKQMLQTAYNVPKAAKYKTTLIALLTMVYVSMFSANREGTEYYFLETEKFIRLRGLHRRKSRKVRMLHHCYVFERLVYESTFNGDVNSTERDDVRNSIESSGFRRYSLDSLSFRLPKWNNLALEMLEARNKEEAENDLHLERPGAWPATLYPEIFGVPEPWLFLLSQVIRLGRERDNSDQCGAANPFTPKDFVTRAKAIEQQIINLCRLNLSNMGSVADQQHIDNMLDAMQHALAIYFYRRTYDMDASMLQSRVAHIRDCLLRCESTNPNALHGFTGFIWPAFIAACEAQDREVQQSFSNWFTGSAEKSGLSSFTDTLGNIERIWREKGSADGVSMTWLDLTK